MLPASRIRYLVRLSAAAAALLAVVLGCSISCVRRLPLVSRDLVPKLLGGDSEVMVEGFGVWVSATDCWHLGFDADYYLANALHAAVPMGGHPEGRRYDASLHLFRHFVAGHLAVIGLVVPPGGDTLYVTYPSGGGDDPDTQTFRVDLPQPLPATVALSLAWLSAPEGHGAVGGGAFTLSTRRKL